MRHMVAQTQLIHGSPSFEPKTKTRVCACSSIMGHCLVLPFQKQNNGWSFACRSGIKQQSKGKKSQLSPYLGLLPREVWKASLTHFVFCYHNRSLLTGMRWAANILRKAPPRMMNTPEFLISIPLLGIWKLLLCWWITSLICICWDCFRQRKLVGVSQEGLWCHLQGLFPTLRKFPSTSVLLAVCLYPPRGGKSRSIDQQ